MRPPPRRLRTGRGRPLGDPRPGPRSRAQGPPRVPPRGQQLRLLLTPRGSAAALPALYPEQGPAAGKGGAGVGGGEMGGGPCRPRALGWGSGLGAEDLAPRLPTCPLSSSSSSSCPGPRPLRRRAQPWPQAGLAVCPPGPQGEPAAPVGLPTEVRGRGVPQPDVCGVWAPNPPPAPAGLRRAEPQESQAPRPCVEGLPPFRLATHSARRGTWPSRAAGPTPGPWGAQSPRSSPSLSPGDPREGGLLPGVSPELGTGRRKGGALKYRGGGGARGPGSRFRPCAPLSSSPRVSISGVSLVAYLGLKDTHASSSVSLQLAGAPREPCWDGSEKPRKQAGGARLLGGRRVLSRVTGRGESSVLPRCCTFRVRACGDPEPAPLSGPAGQQRLPTVCVAFPSCLRRACFHPCHTGCGALGP